MVGDAARVAARDLLGGEERAVGDQKGESVSRGNAGRASTPIRSSPPFFEVFV